MKCISACINSQRKTIITIIKFIRGTRFVAFFSLIFFSRRWNDDENRSQETIEFKALHLTAMRFALLNWTTWKYMISNQIILWWFTQYARANAVLRSSRTINNTNSISFYFHNFVMMAFYFSFLSGLRSPKIRGFIESIALLPTTSFAFLFFRAFRFDFIFTFDVQLCIARAPVFVGCAIFFIINNDKILCDLSCWWPSWVRQYVQLVRNTREWQRATYNFNFFFSFLVVIYLFWLPINHFYFP